MTLKKIKRRFSKISFNFFWPLLPTIILLGLTGLIGHLKVFNIKKISCHIDSHQCSLDFEPFLVTLVDRNIFKLKKNTLVNQLLIIDRNLSEIAVKKTLPNSLEIKAKKRQAIAKITAVDNLEFTGLTSTQSATIAGTITDKFVYLDKSGKIYKTNFFTNEKLPSIFIDSSIDIQSQPQTFGQFFSNLIKTLDEYFVSYHEIISTSNNLVVIKTTLGPYSVFDQKKSLPLQAATLQFVISNIKIEQSVPIKIDLRFDKPILTY